MPKQRDKDGIEFWRGKCRELQKENRQLRKQLGQIQRSKHIYEDVIIDYRDSLEETIIVPEPIVMMLKCPECALGAMEEFQIMDKTIGTCNSCGFRKRIK